MSRSPLAYPLNRGIDADSGGAADLQTDIMRFMAILALCLVAIFALVQSLPMQPTPPPDSEPIVETVVEPEIVVAAPPESMPELEVERPPQPVTEQPPETVALTRPQWVSNFEPRQRIDAMPEPIAAPEPEKPEPAEPDPPPAKPDPHEQGFTLRFESDLALTRLVASGQVGFYAINSGRAQRMTVNNSRISFWDASTPSSFHEMDALTVPRPVVDALARTGANTRTVNWGVTLPGKLSRQLETLMREHAGGSLVIRADGNLDMESRS